MRPRGGLAERLPYLRLFLARFGMAADRPDRHGPCLERTRTEWTDAVGAALAEDSQIPRPLDGQPWRSSACGAGYRSWSGDPRPTVDSSHTLAMKALLPEYPDT